MVKGLNAGLTKGFTINDNPELDILLNEIIRKLNEIAGTVTVTEKTNARNFFNKPLSVTPGTGANPNSGSQQALTDNMGNLVYTSTFNPVSTNGV